MTKLSLSVAAICAALGQTASAADGPETSTLVPLDTARYDDSKMKEVERSDVLHKLSKRTFDRVVFEVPERQDAPKVQYVVREGKEVARQVRDVVESLYVVQKQAVQPSAPWSYKQK